MVRYQILVFEKLAGAPIRVPAIRGAAYIINLCLATLSFLKSVQGEELTLWSNFHPLTMGRGKCWIGCFFTSQTMTQILPKGIACNRWYKP